MALYYCNRKKGDVIWSFVVTTLGIQRDFTTIATRTTPLSSTPVQKCLDKYPGRPIRILFESELYHCGGNLWSRLLIRCRHARWWSGWNWSTIFIWKEHSLKNGWRFSRNLYRGRIEEQRNWTKMAWKHHAGLDKTQMSMISNKNRLERKLSHMKWRSGFVGIYWTAWTGVVCHCLPQRQSICSLKWN